MTAPENARLAPVKQGPIDVVLEQWRRERPDLDASPIGIFGRISRLARVVENSGKQLLRKCGLNPWEYEVLATLRRSGPTYQLAPRQLGKALLVSSGALTNRIDHLERAGLVERLPDPTDRRALLIRLTPEGRKRVDQIVDAYLAREHELLVPLSTRERRTAEDLLRKLLISIESPNGG